MYSLSHTGRPKAEFGDDTCDVNLSSSLGSGSTRVEPKCKYTQVGPPYGLRHPPLDPAGPWLLLPLSLMWLPKSVHNVKSDHNVTWAHLILLFFLVWKRNESGSSWSSKNVPGCMSHFSYCVSKQRESLSAPRRWESWFSGSGFWMFPFYSSRYSSGKVIWHI